MNKSVLIIRRLPAVRHSFSSYFVWIDGVQIGEIPPEPESIEYRFEPDPGTHTVAISVKSLGMDILASSEIEFVAHGKPITLEATAYIRGILFLLEPILPWLWFIGCTRHEITLEQVAEKY